MKSQNRMLRRLRPLLSLVILATLLIGTGGTTAAPNHLPNTPADYNVTTPRDFFGYDIGQDYKLTPWQTREITGEGMRKGIVDYAHELERTSNRVHVFEYGLSEEGRPMILTVITSPENWAQIDNLKGILAKLADPRQVSSDEEARLLAEQGKAVYWIVAAIHASERTSPEVLLRLGYKLASDNDDWTKNLLNNVIVVLENSVNPDGLDMVTDWYYKYKGTQYETSSPPYYNEYINHDNNRDYLGLGMVESQQNAAIRTEWHPTMYHDLHQAQDLLYMSPGPDPSNEAISSITMGEWLGYAGHIMTGLIANGWKGVYTYDYADMWYPGFMNSFTSEYNSNAIFFELTGANYASPRTITRPTGAHTTRTWYDPAPYTVTASSPITWRLIDAVNLEEDGLRQSLDYMVQNKDDLLYNFYLKGKLNMEKATSEPPYAYLIPQNGGDNADVTDMINNLRAHLFEIERVAAPFTVDGHQFEVGDYVIQTDQPYGLLVKNLLDIQSYPPVKTPFDVTAWTYGLLRDVETVPISTPLAGQSLIAVTETVPYAGSLTGALANRYVLEHQSNNNLAKVLPQIWDDSDLTVYQSDAGFTAGGQDYPAGTFIIETQGTQGNHDKLAGLAQQYGLAIHAITEDPGGVELRQPVVGLFTPNTTTSSTMPEGWVRMLMDRDAFPYTRLYPADIAAGKLKGFDVIILPDVSSTALINGSSSSTLPPEYRLGIGQDGVDNLKAFVENGGKLVAISRSSAMPIQQGWPIGVSLPAAAMQALGKAEILQAAEEANPDFPLASKAERASVEEAVRTAQGTAAASLNCPGSILRLDVDTSAAVGYGYDVEEAVWCDSAMTYYTPDAGSPATVVASFPASGELLLSGYASGEEVLQGKAAVVDAPLGDGRVILLGPNVLYRAQATRTYMLFWNALFEGGRQVP